MRRLLLLLLVAGPLTIRVSQMTVANDAVVWLDGRRYACHDKAGCKAFLPGGGAIFFLPRIAKGE